MFKKFLTRLGRPVARTTTARRMLGSHAQSEIGKQVMEETQRLIQERQAAAATQTRLSLQEIRAEHGDNWASIWRERRAERRATRPTRVNQLELAKQALANVRARGYYGEDDAPHLDAMQQRLTRQIERPGWRGLRDMLQQGFKRFRQYREEREAAPPPVLTLPPLPGHGGTV